MEKRYIIMTDLYNSVSNRNYKGRKWFVGFSDEILKIKKESYNENNPSFLEKLRFQDLEKYSYPLEEAKRKLKTFKRFYKKTPAFLMKVTKARKLLENESQQY